MSRFENFTPPTLGSELTSAEITLVESLNAISNSGTGEFLRKEGGVIVNVAISGSFALSDISDITFASLVAGNVLYYNGLFWTNQSLVELLSLSNLSDVNVAGASNGQVLQFNGSSWVPALASGLTIEVPPEAVDGSNITFTVANEPIFVVIDGLVRQDGKGYSYAAGTITVDALTPPNYDIFSVY